jgi:hypothetical protein
MNDSRKSTSSETFAMAGRTSFCRQARASGHLDLAHHVNALRSLAHACPLPRAATRHTHIMCTSSGTLASGSRCVCSCSCPQLQVRASQNRPTTSMNRAAWKRRLDWGRSMVASAGAAFTWSCGCVQGRSGAFDSAGEGCCFSGADGMAVKYKVGLGWTCARQGRG